MELTKAQIENWRKVLGPMAMMLVNADIQTLRDKYYERINEPTSQSQECAPRESCKAKDFGNRYGKTVKTFAETNAQIAKRLGITKRQVAKRRREGTLDV